jgi:hypothetical protein
MSAFEVEQMTRIPEGTLRYWHTATMAAGQGASKWAVGEYGSAPMAMQTRTT